MGLPRVLATLLLCALVASCASPNRQGPQPPPSPERYGAPEVRAPRDVRPFVPQPCTLLTSRQLEEVGFSGPGRPQVLDSTGEPSCEWGGGSSDQSLDVVIVGDRDVLVDTYRTRLYALFQPVEIAGFPAVSEQSSLDSVSCTVTVGTAPEQGLVTTYTQLRGGRADDPCGRGLRVVERIVASLPPLGGK